MRPRSAVIVGLHLLVALVFAGAAAYSAYKGDVAGAVIEAVMGVLVVLLGVGLARAA